jgi:hypothetical protein
MRKRLVARLRSAFGRAVIPVVGAFYGLNPWSAAQADLSNATVEGALLKPYNTPGNFIGPNLFDPAVGYVPPGYGNSASPVVVFAADGSGNFAFSNRNSIDNPAIDSWLVEFAGTTLTAAFNSINYGGPLAGSLMTFKSNAFVGASIVRVGDDDFAAAGNGEMSAEIIGDTLVLTVGPQCLVGVGCLWHQQVYRNTYELSFPDASARFDLKSSEVAGCKSVVGTVSLTEPAPPGGATVEISESLVSAVAPALMQIPEGKSTGAFRIRTSAVAEPESGSVDVKVYGRMLSRDLTVRPIGPQSISLSPAQVVGSQPVEGLVKLECKAGPGAITVELDSDEPGAANSVAASVAVPEGLRSVAFDVTTSAVLQRTSVTLSATANELTRSRRLTVLPAALLSPGRLTFGGVPVGQTSAPLDVTLRNQGTSSFSITGMSFTGSGAAWFTQENDCPATLPAGGSCTIELRFTPQSVRSRSAHLDVSTSATSLPLSVAVSGSGT